MLYYSLLLLASNILSIYRLLTGFHNEEWLLAQQQHLNEMHESADCMRKQALKLNEKCTKRHNFAQNFHP